MSSWPAPSLPCPHPTPPALPAPPAGQPVAWIATLAVALVATAGALAMTQVELDVFSGRPNPAWTLSAADARALARQLADLPPAAAPQPLPELGYRGFVITGDGADGGPVGPLRVRSGTVATPQGPLADRHGAEAWLFDKARAQGWGPLVDALVPR